MSSGCCHPKISFSLPGGIPTKPPTFSPRFWGVYPFQGDKKSEEPIFSTNSASQTFVSLQLNYFNRSNCQQFISTLSVGVVLNNATTLSALKQRSTEFFTFLRLFLPLQPSVSQRTWRKTYSEVFSPQEFFEKIFSF